MPAESYRTEQEYTVEYLTREIESSYSSQIIDEFVDYLVQEAFYVSNIFLKTA